MRIIYTSDLHGNTLFYQQLADLAKKEGAEVIIIGGDLLPKEGNFDSLINKQQTFINNFLSEYLLNIRKEKREVYLMLGNDDFAEANTPLIKELASNGFCHLIHCKKFKLNDEYELLGYHFVPPTPFSVKDTERLDKRDLPYEISNATAVKGLGNYFELIYDVGSYFKNKPSIEEDLKQRLPKPKNWGRTIFVSHAPPYNTYLDVLYNWRPVGSVAIKEFIKRKQPFLSLHGHIHEAPEVSGSYVDMLGKTICANPGQLRLCLSAAVFDLGKTKTAKRVVVGDSSASWTIEYTSFDDIKRRFELKKRFVK